MKFLSALSYANSFEVINNLTRFQTLQHIGNSTQWVDGNEHPHRLPDSLLGRIPIHLLRTGVPTGNGSFERPTNNRVIRARNNRGEPAKIFFRTPPAADIADGTANPYPLLCAPTGSV